MRLLKIFIFFLFILVSAGAHSQVYWLRQPSPTSVWLMRCSFPDTLNGWACGDSGIIVHSSNGGTNWNIQYTGINYFVEDICFTNKRLGWGIANDYGVAYRSYVLKTTNGGINWAVTPYPDSTIILSTVYFLDSLNGYIGGFNGVILKTTNAGFNWNRMTVDSSFYYRFHIKRFNFFNERVGAACGGIMDFGGVLWLTTNYGYNWQAIAIGPEPIYSMKYLDSSRVIATGGDFEYGGSFSKSYNNWTSWNYNLLSFGIGQSIAMRTPREIWIPMAFSQTWAVSSDTGNTWSVVVNPDSTSIYDAVFADSTHGWAVGNFGSIYKFNRQIIGVNNNNLPAKFRLFQNYPNPFNPSTNIKYQITNNNTSVKLKVFDITGKEIAVLVNQEQNAGTYIIAFKGENLPSGIYFYKIESGNFSDSRKMVLVK